MHLSWDELVDYWADEHPDPDAIEAHTMGCVDCTTLSERVAAVTHALGRLVPPFLSTEALAKLRTRGLRIDEAVFQPEDRREVVFPRELDVLIFRLQGLPDDAVRLDFTMFIEGTETRVVELANVPFVQGTALLACQQHYASLPPDVVVSLRATHADGRQTETRYTILHRFESLWTP
jgi:hypothetical protein